MINHNPEIEVIIANATELAKKYNHEYVTLEHLAHGLLSFKPFGELMYSYGIDVDGALDDLDEYLQKQTYIASIDEDNVPSIIHSTEKERTIQANCRRFPYD